MTFEELSAGFQGFRNIEIEIGCGNGHFLAEYCARNPETLLIGIELKKKRCMKAQAKVRKRGLGNASILRGSAEGFLRELPACSVDAFHIYFPDPWPKTRHRKRRFFCRDNVAMLHAGLKPGGKVFFSTDFFDYYVQAKVLFLLHGGFSLVDEHAPEEAFLSIYSQKFAGTRKAVHLITAIRQP